VDVVDGPATAAAAVGRSDVSGRLVIALQIVLQKTVVLRHHHRGDGFLVRVRFLANRFEPPADHHPAAVLLITVARLVVVVVVGYGWFGVTQPRRVVRHRTAVLVKLVPEVFHAHRQPAQFITT